MKENQPVNKATELVISKEKSNRLAAILNKSQGVNKQDKLPTIKTTQSLTVDLKPETKTALMQANKMLDDKLSYIMQSYPVGKKSSFFKLKYGIELANLKNMAIQDSFKLLKLNQSTIQHFKLIKILNCNGNNAD